MIRLKHRRGGRNGLRGCKPLAYSPNFHEKAVLSKPDEAATTTVNVGYPCHASIRTSMSPLLSGAVHYAIHPFGLQALHSSDRSLLLRGRPKLGAAVAFYEIRNDRVTYASVARACYEPTLRVPTACWRKRQANATKCSSAKVAGSLS